MSAWDDFVQGYTADAQQPAAEPLPDDIPDIDSDYAAKHKRAAVYYPIIDRYAKDYPDVPDLAGYAKAMMLRESGGNPGATSSANARGLMQLIPSTYADMGGDPSNAYDPEDNLKYGVKYIANQYRDYGDWKSALAAYNWGPGKVDAYGTSSLPPETDNYIKAVNAYRKRLKPSGFEFFTDEAPAAPDSAGNAWNQFVQDYAQNPTSSPAAPTGQRMQDVNPAFAPFVPPGMPLVQSSPQAAKIEAQDKRQKAQLEAEGAEYYQAAAGETPQPTGAPVGQPQPLQAVNPTAAPFAPPGMPPLQSYATPTPSVNTTTPESYQASKMGVDRGALAPLGDLEAMSSTLTRRLIETLQGKSLFEAAGERMEATKAALEHKQYLQSPQYQQDLAQAYAKKQQGQELNPQEEAALKADPSFWQEMGDLAKQFAQDPGEMVKEFGLQTLKDLPTFLLTGEGIGGLLKLKTVGEVGKSAEGILGAQRAAALGKIGQEAAQNVGAVGAVNYPQAVAGGQDYGPKEVARDVLTGAIIGGAAHALGKAPEALKAEPEATPKAPATPEAAGPTPEAEAQRALQNAALIANVRKAGAEAGIPPDHVELFLQKYKNDLQRTDEPLEFVVERMIKEEAPQNIVHVGDQVYRSLLVDRPAGAGGRYLAVNPEDVGRLGLYKGMASNPEPMTPAEMWSRMGVPVKIDPAAPKLNDLAHTFLQHEGEDVGARATNRYIGVDTPDKEYGFSADDLATALINRPRGKEALEREVKAATQGQDQAAYDQEQEAAWNALTPEQQAEHQRQWAESARQEPAPVDEGLPDEGPSPIALNPDMEALRKAYNAGELQQKGSPKLMQMGSDKEGAKPAFYSQLERVVEDKMPNAMGPEALKNMLKANAVKDEEIKWTGLDDLLRGKEKVTKKEVQDHLAQNQIQIEEVHKANRNRREAGGETAFAEEGDDGRWHVYGEAANEGDIYDTESEAKAKVAEYNRNLPTSPTKYEGYQEPGAHNYRELLLTKPRENFERQRADIVAEIKRAHEAYDMEAYHKANQQLRDLNARSILKTDIYRSSHWDEPNVLAHVRFNDRVTPDGKKVLHLEEVQSDWHQAGRKKGYELPKGKTPSLAEAKEFFGISNEAWDKMSPEDRQSYVDEIVAGGNHLKGGVPDAPFKKTWHEMALRRMLRYAAENGYDYMTWTGGEKQAARYDLSKHIDRIQYVKEDGKYWVGALKNDREIPGLENKAMDEHELEATFGKEIASKIVNGEGSSIPGGPEKELSGLDLKVGGEGMKGFYDKIVPEYLNKYAKKWGAKVERVPIDWDPAIVNGEVQLGVPHGRLMDHYQGIPITPEMKASVMEGQPLFQGTDVKKGSYQFDERLQKHVISLVKGQADLSTLFHEYFHYLEQSGALSPAERGILGNALKAYGIQNIYDQRDRFTPEAAEKAARWYERWLRDGKVRDPELQPVFDKISSALREIYKTTRGTELTEVPEKVAKVFKTLPEMERPEAPEENLSSEMAGTEPVEKGPQGDVVLQSMMVPGLKEFIEQDAAPVTRETKQAFKDLLGDITKVLSPRTGVRTDALDMVYRMKGDREKAMYTISEGMRSIKKMFIKMGDEANIAFIDRIKRGEKQPTEKLQRIADTYRELEDETFKEFILNKPTLAYKEGHFRLFYSNYKILDANPKLKASLEGGKGFMKKMIFPDLTSAMEAGLTPISLNPQVLFEKSYADALRYISAQRMWRAIKDRGLAVFVKTGERPPDGYAKLDDKISRVYFKGPRDEFEKTGDYYVESNVARILNNYLSEDWLRSRAYGRGLLALKNLTTGIELSISPFHFMFETLDAMASKFGLGLTKLVNQGDIKGGLSDLATAWKAPYDFARTGGKALKYFANKEAFSKSVGGQKFLQRFPDVESLMDDLFLGGGKLAMHEDYKVNSLDTFKQNLTSHNYIGALLRAFPAANELMMKPLFEVYIPRLKVGLFLHEMSQQLSQHADALALGKESRAKLARETWDRVENRFGEMNFDNLFWNRSFKTAMQLMFRSVTWKLGSLRGMGSAVWNQGRILAEATALIKDAEGQRGFKRPKLDPSAAWMLGVLSTTATLSTIIQKSLTGQWPQQPIDFMFPKDGTKDKNGNDNRVSLPTYLRDAFSFKHNPVTYVAHSTSGLAAHLFDVLQNRDFYGDFVFDPDGSLTSKAWDIAKYMAPKPFSATQLTQSLQSTGPAANKALGLLGVYKAPKEYIQTPFQEELARAFERQVGFKPKTPEQKELKQEKRDYLQKLREGKVSGAEILDATEKGLVKPKSVRRDVKMSGLSPMQYMWKMLSKDEKMRLDPLMSDEERKILMWPRMPKMPELPKPGQKAAPAKT
jgi:hypothetical protein